MIAQQFNVKQCQQDSMELKTLGFSCNFCKLDNDRILGL